jgi:fatty acid synthase, animal type
LFDQLRQADMVMNVFRSGKWGSFRHLLDCMDVDNSVIKSERQLNDFISKLTQHCNEHWSSQSQFPYRVQTQATTQPKNAYINFLTRGDLSSLTWIQAPETMSFTSQREQLKRKTCQVSYAALNFRDIMLATGKLSPEAIPGFNKMQNSLLGMEFSGICQDKLHQQRRVMGMVQSMGLSLTLNCESKYLWDIPREWTLEQAATVPVAYSTAYYALCVRANLKEYESVLIHAASGAVGQAAISIALSKKCRVFVTCSSEEKRCYLKDVFPKLNDACIFNSRDCDFERLVMHATQGRGVDCVLNCLSGDKLQASVRVLAQHGRFLEIGKFDLSRNFNLGMACFLKNISFHGILVDSLFENKNQEWCKVYQLVEEGIRSGVVRPLRSNVFEMNQVEQAFRFMSQGKHIGKVLIKVCDLEQTQSSSETSKMICDSMKQANALKNEILMNAMPKLWFSPSESFIVTGGLGGFGLELCQWLVERGARFIVLTSRSGVKTAYQTKKIQCLQREFGATIKVSLYDICDEAQCMSLFREAVALSDEKKIAGIFHLAGIVEDKLFDNQTIDSFRSVNSIKNTGTYNLDKCSRLNNWMNDSALFLVWSSIVAGRGNLGKN